MSDRDISVDQISQMVASIHQPVGPKKHCFCGWEQPRLSRFTSRHERSKIREIHFEVHLKYTQALYIRMVTEWYKSGKQPQFDYAFEKDPHYTKFREWLL